MSKKHIETLGKNHIVASSPKEALKLLENFKEVIIAGGECLNASLLKENLIDEIYLDIEPTLIGQGIPLANGADFETKLKLFGTRQIGENEIQLHYQVIK